jgi:hypothetical protein
MQTFFATGRSSACHAAHLGVKVMRERAVSTSFTAFTVFTV